MKSILKAAVAVLFLFSVLMQGAQAANADDACFHNVIRDALNFGKTMRNLGPRLDQTYNYSIQNQPVVPLPRMINDSGLRSSATNTDKFKSCKFEHSDTGGVGENLFVGSETGLSAADWPTKRNWTIHNAVNDWAYEARLMVFQSGGSTVGCNDGSSGATCRSKIGHYTQMMWDDTTNVGCASKFCSKVTQDGRTLFEGKQSTLMVCHYSPQGNIVQTQNSPYNAPYVIGPSKSSSVAPLSGCNDGLGSGGSGFNIAPIMLLLTD